MRDLMESIINEIDIKGLLAKQRSITRQFPTFFQRVKKVADMGGIRLDSFMDTEWVFKAHSGTQEDKWWEVRIRFLDIPQQVVKHTMNMKLWKKDKSSVDMRKLAQAVLAKVQVQTFCNCPADLYWSHQYTRSNAKYNAKIPPPEDRRPTRNNTHEYGAMCKHHQLVFNLLPHYEGTFAKFLSRFYAEQIHQAEENSRKRLGRFQALGQELGRRVEGEATA